MKKMTPGISVCDPPPPQKKDRGAEKATSSSASLDQGTGAAAKSVCPSVRPVPAPKASLVPAFGPAGWAGAGRSTARAAPQRPPASRAARPARARSTRLPRTPRTAPAASRSRGRRLVPLTCKQPPWLKYSLFLSPRHQQPSACAAVYQETPRES